VNGAGSRSKVAGKRKLSVSRSALRASPRPYVIVNMAMTADGKIATANRSVSSFGSRRDHDHLLELRATADAVLCGASTAGGDNITMGPGPIRLRRLRLRRGLAEFNLRIIASGSGRLDAQSSIFAHPFSPIIVLTTRRAPAANLRRLRTVADEVATFGTTDLDLAAALRWLRQQWNVKRLICEGGGELNDAMFRAGLVDELQLTVCPKVFGGRRAPTIVEGEGFARLADAAQLTLRSRRLEGDELFLVYEVARPARSPSRVSARRAINQSRSDRRLK
jgi:riboflavin-specific deaminase-like protein